MPLPDSITHYHYPDKAPFLNLSDLDAGSRAPVLAALNARAAEGHTLRAFPEWYMPQRIEAETRVRALYTAKFGKPERAVPHYFTLGASPVLERIYKNNFRKVVLPVDAFDPHELCFCINDSLWTMANSHNPDAKWNNRWFEGKLYTYAETCAILEELGINPENEDSLKQHKLGFIEALVWTDKPLYLYRHGTHL